MHACKLTPTQNIMTHSGYSTLYPLSLSLCLCRANCAAHKGWQKWTVSERAFSPSVRAAQTAPLTRDGRNGRSWSSLYVTRKLLRPRAHFSVPS